MRSTDYISKGTAVARLYKARESLLMDKDCRKGLCFYLRGVDILDYLEEIGIWNLDSFSIEVLWAYEDFINRGSIVVGFWVPLNTRSQNFLVFKGEYGSVKFNIYK